VSHPLDEFIPHPDVRERFTIVIRAPAALVMAVARDFDMQAVPLVRRIFRLREWIMGSPAAVRRPQGLVAETTALGWGLLRDEPHRLIVAGAICQPWLADVRFESIPRAEFAARAEPDRVKIVWSLEAEPIDETTTRLATETRVVATDEAARVKFRRYWRWARFGIVSIRWLLLPAVRREAEARWRAPGCRL
jgi:hypothetical protein